MLLIIALYLFGASSELINLHEPLPTCQNDTSIGCWCEPSAYGSIKPICIGRLTIFTTPRFISLHADKDPLSNAVCGYDRSQGEFIKAVELVECKKVLGFCDHDLKERCCLASGCKACKWTDSCSECHEGWMLDELREHCVREFSINAYLAFLLLSLLVGSFILKWIYKKRRWATTAQKE